MSQGSTPPGWYDDGSGRQRWWDGVQWAPDQPVPQQPEYAQPYQPHGQGPYGQGHDGQGPSGQPPRKRTGLVVGLVAALVVVAGGIVAAVLLLGGSDDTEEAGGGSTPAETAPSDVVRTFLQASLDGDCDTALDQLTAELRADESDGCEDFDPETDLQSAGIDPDDIGFEIADAEIDGDTAVVPATITGFEAFGGEDDFTQDFELTEVDGRWLISGYADDDSPAPSASGAPEPSSVPADPFEDVPTDFPTDLDDYEDYFGDIPTDPAELESYLEDLESQYGG